MINIQTYLKVVDNTGVKKILCIRILKKKKKCGIIGDIIIGTVKEVLPKSKIKKSDIIRGLIVRSTKLIKRSNGINIYFHENALILITKDNNPLGTRIFGPIPREIGKKGFNKVMTLAVEIC